MDLYLRPHSTARSHDAERHNRDLEKPEKLEPEALNWYSERCRPKGASLSLRNCRLLRTDVRFDVEVENGVIESVLPHDPSKLKDSDIDLKGAYLLPGFCDSHVHLLPGGERLRALELEDVDSVKALADRVKSFAEEHPENEVLRVYDLKPKVLETQEARHQLDKMVKDRPLVILSPDLHTLWVNTKALEDSELFRCLRPLPEELSELKVEDLIELDSEGFPTGELREPQCYFLIDGALREKYPTSLEERVATLKAAVQHLNSFGITTVHNMGLALPEEDVELVYLAQELERRGELSLRIHSSYSIVPDRYMLGDIKQAASLRDNLIAYGEGKMSWTELRDELADTLASFEDSPRYKKTDSPPSNFYSRGNLSHLTPYRDLDLPEAPTDSTLAEKLTMNAVKLFTDGVIRQGTAYRSDADSDPVFASEELKRVVALADSLSLQVRAHAIGDKAVGQMLDAVAHARRKNRGTDNERGHTVRHRVEHIELCQTDDIPRFKQLNVVPSMQPLHYNPYPDEFYDEVSQDMWDHAFPWQSLKQKGALPAFSSDWPIASCHTLEALRQAISRKPCSPSYLDQSLSLEDAVEAFTRKGAEAVHAEHQVGRIEPGQLADLVVLTTDNLDKAEVALTILAGKVVFSRSSTASNVPKPTVCS